MERSISCMSLSSMFHVRFDNCNTMSVVKIKIVYDYYSNRRVTPFFIREEELVSLGFDELKARLFTEIPYLNKMATSLRLAVVEDKWTCPHLILTIK